jgi:hypothetical protein
VFIFAGQTMDNEHLPSRIGQSWAKAPISNNGAVLAYSSQPPCICTVEHLDDGVCEGTLHRQYSFTSSLDDDEYIGRSHRWDPVEASTTGSASSVHDDDVSGLAYSPQLSAKCLSTDNLRSNYSDDDVIGCRRDGVSAQPPFEMGQGTHGDAAQVVAGNTCPSTMLSTADHHKRPQPALRHSTNDEAAATGYPVMNEHGAESYTTVMVRNLVSSLQQRAFLQQLNALGYKGRYDFLYMPMNFRDQGNNFGYAFVNFLSPQLARQFMSHVCILGQNGGPDSWQTSWSTCQGVDANIERYRNSPLMHGDVPDYCKPALLDTYGNKVQFPLPTKPIPKPRVHRTARAGKGKTSTDRWFPGCDGWARAQTVSKEHCVGKVSGDAAIDARLRRSKKGPHERFAPIAPYAAASQCLSAVLASQPQHSWTNSGLRLPNPQNVPR